MLIASVQVIHAHMEWMLLPAVQLHQCLMGLARPDFRNGGPIAAIRGILDISPLERASCMNQQAFLEAKTRTDELEPGRMDPTSVHGVRGWIRQCKELVCSHCEIAELKHKVYALSFKGDAFAPCS